MSLVDFNTFTIIGAGDYTWFKIVYSNNTSGATWDVFGWLNTVGFSGPQGPSYSNSDDFIFPPFPALPLYTINGWNSTTTQQIGNSPWTPSSIGSTVISSNSQLPDPSTGNLAANSITTIYVYIEFDGTGPIPNRGIQARNILAGDPTCFRGESLVTIFNPETKEESTKAAKDIVKGDMVKSVSRGFVPVLANLITGATSKKIKLSLCKNKNFKLCLIFNLQY
jgi:hypothetical protein